MQPILSQGCAPCQWAYPRKPTVHKTTHGAGPYLLGWRPQVPLLYPDQGVFCPHGRMRVPEGSNLAYCPSCAPAEAARWAGTYWLANVLDLLEDVHWAELGEGHYCVAARCPCGRAGKEVYLELSSFNDGFGVHIMCHRGCTPWTVMEAIGLDYRHRWPWHHAEYYSEAGPLLTRPPLT